MKINVYNKMKMNKLCSMRKFCCHVAGFESYGLFVGMLLQEQRSHLTSAKKCEKFRNSDAFYNIVSDKLEYFLSIYDYNRSNIEKFFAR